MDVVRSSGASAREPSCRYAGSTRKACLPSSRKAVRSSLPGPPARPPLGLHLARATKEISRAFDDALAEAGGSGPIWLVLISLKTRPAAPASGNWRDAVGIREATLTHHLNAMDASGLITRRRDPENRRVHLVELTPAGEEAFFSGCAGRRCAFDAQAPGRLRRGGTRGVRAGTRPAARQRSR